MEKPTSSFLDRFTATRGRPRTFQVITILLFLLTLAFAITGMVRLVLKLATRA